MVNILRLVRRGREGGFLKPQDCVIIGSLREVNWLIILSHFLWELVFWDECTCTEDHEMSKPLVPLLMWSLSMLSYQLISLSPSFAILRCLRVGCELHMFLESNFSYKLRYFINWVRSLRGFDRARLSITNCAWFLSHGWENPSLSFSVHLIFLCFFSAGNSTTSLGNLTISPKWWWLMGIMKHFTRGEQGLVTGMIEAGRHRLFHGIKSCLANFKSALCLYGNCLCGGFLCSKKVKRWNS